METTPKPMILIWSKKHYKILTVLATFLLLIVFYFFIKTRHTNHLSNTHVMYIAIVFCGSILGIHAGFMTALFAGILVGPLMPFDLVTGEQQLFQDWFFRLVMMLIVGVMSGYFSKNYRYIQDKLLEITTIVPETGLKNIRALSYIPIENDKSYLLMTMNIKNDKTICEASGYEIYYEYLKQVNHILTTYDQSLNLIQVDKQKLWVFLDAKEEHKQINEISKLIKDINHIGPTKLFIDFGLGFHQIRFDKQKEISYYFTYTDQAAQEALDKHVLYVKYMNLERFKQQAYELLTEFEKSLHNGDIFLAYQPKINLETNKPIGLEALIRWYHPLKKMIYPDQFIPAVEETSLIHLMTKVVFKKALDYHIKLKEKGIPIPISINISAKNLQDDRFYQEMIDIFNTYDILPEMVEFEITESVLMDEPEKSKTVLDQFSHFGFRIAIDDFGKGYSSLAYLAQFPINTIKIDRLFTKQVLISPVVQTIVQATIQMALQLGYEVLIEGVEDIETANLLKSYGCHTAQGYYYLKPQQEQAVTEYLVNAYTK
jgi:EAL domain-containing protein (putative c-di-GMP-specific phosphodiesterase class I)